MQTLTRPRSEPLSRGDFDRIADFVRRTSGIQLPPAKLQMVETRLQRRVRQLGLESTAQYCAAFFASGEAEPERTALLNAVTTNKTDFFREARHFDHLIGTLMRQMADRAPVRVWSAACSIGAEPYTLAMLLDRHRQAGGPRWEMLATDIDTDVLEIARHGIFPREMLEPVPSDLMQAYVHQPRDPGRPQVRICPRLRAQIRFARLNLMDARYAVGAAMDVIFCRNVLIYFDKPTQERVVGKLAEVLAPGGHLYLGHSESITGFDLPLTQVASAVYKKG